MATVALTEAWLHNAADLTDYVTFKRESSDEDTGVQGDVRTYAAGRRRAVTREGVDTTVSVQTRLEGDAGLVVVQWIRDMAGVTVLYRDPDGLRVWGVYFKPHVQAEPAGFYLVRFDIARLTVDDVV